MGWEQRLGFEAGRFTSVNLGLTSILGLGAALGFYGGVWVVDRFLPWMDFLTTAFLRPKTFGR